jgi:hypothetical protein
MIRALLKEKFKNANFTFGIHTISNNIVSRLTNFQRRPQMAKKKAKKKVAKKAKKK